MNLNLEQKKLITATPGGVMLVRGVAGSGKTTVAVHRAEYLLNNYCLNETDRVLIVTFNNTLVKYLRYLYEKVNIEEGGYASLFGPSKSQVDIMTIDSLFQRYYFSFFDKSQRRKLLYNDNNKKFQIIRNCIAELKKSLRILISWILSMPPSCYMRLTGFNPAIIWSYLSTKMLTAWVGKALSNPKGPSGCEKTLRPARPSMS